MTSSISFSSPSGTLPERHTLVRIAPATLHALSEALNKAVAQSTADTTLTLRDAGYAGGEAFYADFERYVHKHTDTKPHDLDIHTFFHLAGSFFTESGWGHTTLSEQDGAFCLVEIESEPEDDDTLETSTHITVGVLSAFLEKFANYPVSVLELGATHGTIPTRRFLAGPMASIAGYYAQHPVQHPSPHNNPPSP